MGNVPARGFVSRPGRSNRRNRGNETSSGGPSLVPSGHWYFYEYPLTERDPAEPVDTGDDEEPKPEEPKPDTEPEPKPEPKPATPVKPPTPVSTKPENPLKVTYIELRRKENEAAHTTSEYDPEESRMHMIVRRGQPFDITLELDRPYDKEHDEIRIVFEIEKYIAEGPEPKPSNGAQVTMHMKKGLRKRNWGCEYISSKGKKLEVRVEPAADAIIGRWNIIAQSSFLQVPQGEKKVFSRFKHFAKVYIIFNPFNKDDQVYMEDETERDEYVMAESGHIFVGNYRQPWARPWNFGQFEEDVLDCAMLLLEMSGLRYDVRGNPVFISRAISATANQADENGVLVGNWSGNYEGGASPTSWVGSIKIIQQFYETRQPVTFGQCWVFSGVVTALCRALGLPTRSVTNFASAHDTDESATIDIFWSEDGTKDEWRTSDSVWNFHVWNEAWMTRPDLPGDNDGWQAFDATPQEASDNIYQAGPAPCKAIKEGIVDLRYDTQFIFSEVNADRVNWKMVDGEWIVTTVEKNRIGLKISTNVPRKQTRPVNPYAPSSERYRLDVTDHYKHKEGSPEERAAVRRAHSKAVSPREGIYDHNTKDVSFTLNMKEDVMLGQNFDVALEIQNKSREKRTVTLTLSLDAVQYTGVVIDRVKTKKFHLEIDPIKAQEAVMRILFEEYSKKVGESATFAIEIDASVAETSQNYSTEEEFRLKRPDIEITGPTEGKVGQPFQITLKFTSTLPIPLTDCEWEIEGPGITRPLGLKESDCAPYQTVERIQELTPKKAGERTITVNFTSKQLHDVIGTHVIKISK